MTAYIALLRGINVSGKNSLPMAELHANHGRHRKKNLVSHRWCCYCQ